MKNITIYPHKSGFSLQGKIQVEGDKSISHRALIIASQAIGDSHITGLLEAEDVLHTLSSLQQLGVMIEKIDEATWKVTGNSLGGYIEPSEVLYLGNSGTGCRLLLGALSCLNIKVFFSGDASLSSRPMGRILKPIKLFGCNSNARCDNNLPLLIEGAKYPLAIDSYELPIASSQLKSAMILGALNADGISTIIEPIISRDHTEIMLQYFGGGISISEKNSSRLIEVTGNAQYISKDISIPKDPSSAAFFILAGLLIENSEILLEDICVNPHRIGLIKILQSMGGDITITNQRTICGEEVADILVKSSNLVATDFPSNIVVSMIDEFPILSVAASFCQGTTKMSGLKELKVKESNRLLSIYNLLKSCGVSVTMGEESLEIVGQLRIKGNVEVDSLGDHRIAMSAIILGIKCDEGINVSNIDCINTSFPSFLSILDKLNINYKTKTIK